MTVYGPSLLVLLSTGFQGSVLLSSGTYQPRVARAIGDLGTVVRPSVPGAVSAHTTQGHFRSTAGGCERRHVTAVPSFAFS